MWTTVEEVKNLTGYDVTIELVGQAQGIIESYVGRLEADINSPTDQMILGRATAYQAAYMLDEEERTFQQVGAKTVSNLGNMIAFREDDMASPFVAPLAILACRRLSWKGSRSVRTGGMHSAPVIPTEWRRD